MVLRLAIAATFLLLILGFLSYFALNPLYTEESVQTADAVVPTRLPKATSQPTALPTPEASPTPKESWLKLPPMPASATEADVGAEIYRLVCRDCHGDKGQGLTDGWRATWNPDHQNCWQSKCHAPNHPVNGFDLPRYVPAIIGSNTLARFSEPAQLHDYILANMPWHDPGSLTSEEYWQLTAFLIRENGGDPTEMR